MVTLVSIIPSLAKCDWFTALDFKDSYFHIDIDPADQRFLRFTVSLDCYQYNVLSFGLSMAPMIFTKVLSVVVAHLLCQGSSFPTSMTAHEEVTSRSMDDNLVLTHTLTLLRGPGKCS